MLAVHLADGRVEVRRRARLPRRPPGYSLIRLLCAGICNTDLELGRGYYGFRGRPGHEFVGMVVETDLDEIAGQRVTGDINLECGRCEWCARSLGRHCPHRKVLGIAGHPGAFAEYLTLPDWNLHRLADHIPTRHAVFTEPIAAACEILEQVRIPKGERVAVLGDGKLGLLIAQVLTVAGLRVHQFGRHPNKLAISEKAGVAATEVVRKRLPVAAYDWVVEATGSAEALQQAAAMARPRGTVIMKSTVHSSVPLSTAPIIVNEVTLVGSRCGRFPPALGLLEFARLHLDEMISDVFPLERAPQAFARAIEDGVIKVLLEPGPEGRG